MVTAEPWMAGDAVADLPPVVTISATRGAGMVLEGRGESTFDALAALPDSDDLAALQLERFRRRRDLPPSWSPDHYRIAVAKSELKAKVKGTLIAMLDFAQGQYTTVSREDVCTHVGIRREETITEHWRRAREEGLLYSKQRFNQSSVHQFLIPGVDTPDIDGIEMSITRNTHHHRWTLEEEVWWYSLGTDNPQPPPWGDGECPF